MAGFGLASVRIGNHLCGEPLDISGTTDLPEWAATTKNRDGLAYPAHMLLGEALKSAQCHPRAVALQWLKAASHARTPGELDAVGKKLAGLLEISPTPDEMRADMCQGITRGWVNPRQVDALARAGVTCSSRPP